MPAQDVIDELREQIERTGVRTERDCGILLSRIAHVLLIPVGGRVVWIDTEQICSAGRVDFVVIAETTPAGGPAHREAYAWELKAPQVSLFELESNNRACPTEHLHSAEDQLLHYHHSIANDGHFRSRWGIVSRDRVRFGGIIIGRDANLVECSPDEMPRGSALASQARDIRELYFYRRDITLWTWDRVLELAESVTGYQRIMGATSAVTDVSASRPTELTVFTTLPPRDPPA